MDRQPFGGLRYGCNMYEAKKPKDYVFRMAKIMDKNKLAAGRIRIRFLESQLKGLEKSDHEIARFWADEIREEINFVEENMHWEPKEVQGSDSITESDIQAAKAYPITQLIDFTNGTAFAWCHDDNRPSLAHLSRLNKVKCFPCNKTFDTIDVLVERDGHTFISAVKELR